MTAQRLRAEAALCRRMARQLSLRQDAERLVAMAEAHEERAAALEEQARAAAAAGALGQTAE